jgi:ATP-dependent Clp protease protease subunit
MASDIEIQAKEILYLRERLNKMLSEWTGQSVEKISRDVERDFFLSAQSAKDYGIIDDILERRAAVPAPKST